MTSSRQWSSRYLPGADKHRSDRHLPHAGGRRHTELLRTPDGVANHGKITAKARQKTPFLRANHGKHASSTGSTPYGTFSKPSGPGAAAPLMENQAPGCQLEAIEPSLRVWTQILRFQAHVDSGSRAPGPHSG